MAVYLVIQILLYPSITLYNKICCNYFIDSDIWSIWIKLNIHSIIPKNFSRIIETLVEIKLSQAKIIIINPELNNIKQ